MDTEDANRYAPEVVKILYGIRGGSEYRNGPMGLEKVRARRP